MANQSAGQGLLEIAFGDDSELATVVKVGIGDVFGWIGQSNAEGYFDNGQAYTGTLPAGIYDQDDEWKQLASNYSDPDGAHYSMLPLLASLISDDQSVPVGFVANPDGSTSLVRYASPHWPKGGVNYDEFVSMFGASGVNDLKAFLWYQGEEDAGGGVTKSDYQTALSQMLDDFQSDLSISSKLICACIGPHYTSCMDCIDYIRLAQIDRWDNDADIEPGPTGHDQDFSVHWTTDAEATRLSNRWWRVIDAALYGGAEAARGPQFSSATRSGTTVTVTFTGGEGNLQNQDDEMGFTFTDDGEEIEITGASANGTDAVDLTLASTPSGTELISFAHGNDAKGATLCDSGTYPLPPEPFVDEAVT